MTIDGAFRARVLAREFLAGFWLNLGSAVTAEMAGLAGFDWVLLDHEHGPGGEETLLHQLQAVSATPAACLVRVAANEPPRFKRVLDAGAHGVMVPYVSTADEARAAVNALRYPPRGTRGVAKLTRASSFGARFDDYFAHAHEWLVTLTQIETTDAVANAAEIASVDGVDVLFVGPMDLTTSMGISGQYDDARFHDALGAVADAAREHNKAAGILLLDPANLPLCRELGYTVVALGSDGGAVQAGLTASRDRLGSG
ncbi:MAG TPA: aldolase/citrate lyase family protein [Gemmatimonadaceae bacterium]|jgi:4-hydroxy-2-oxoheptanedioate aldolase|nr:aldolase/citrate lyase family protein [Gemmatimonadaceae bacterium]